MLSQIENVRKAWHGYGTGFGGYGTGLMPYYYGTEACAIPMARWQARVQNHTLSKNSYIAIYIYIYGKPPHHDRPFGLFLRQPRPEKEL